MQHSYGLNVKSAPVAGGATYSDQFDYSYGVSFTQGKTFTFFADSSPDNGGGKYGDGMYINGSDILITSSTIKGNSIIDKLCVGASTCFAEVNTLDITFKRPNPDAIITVDGLSYPYGEVTLKATDGSIKKVIIRSTGQIAVTN